MGDKTGIEWTDATWNPTTGCDRVSPGCDHCYALTMAKRLKAMGSERYQLDGDPTTSGPGFGIAMHPDALDQPLRWKRGRRIFVNSMSDLFHSGVTDEFIARVFAVMACAPQHTFQILTKRHGRMRSLLSRPDFERMVLDAKVGPEWSPVPGGGWAWPLPNVWLGTSVEDQKRADLRIPHLLETPAAVRFLSMEPLLGPVYLSMDAHNGTPPLVDWIIVGGESGPGARPMHPDWVRDIRNQAVEHGAAFHFKQWGAWAPRAGRDAPTDLPEVGRQVHHWDRHDARTHMTLVGAKAAGRTLDGRTWDEWPDRDTDPAGGA